MARAKALGSLHFSKLFRVRVLTLCAQAANGRACTNDGRFASPHGAGCTRVTRAARASDATRGSSLRDADLVAVHGQRARQPDERECVARYKTAGHDVDDLAARFAGRDRALERDAVVVQLCPDDERVVRAVGKRRHEPYHASIARDVRSATTCVDALATASQNARNEWWMPRALRDECLTLVRECVLITRNTRGAWRFT